MNLGEAARIILEIGDTTLPYEWIAWKKGKKDFLRSAAKTSGKIELLITFDTYLSSGVTEVIFHTNLDTDSYDGEGSWSTTKTGTGNEFKIFSTVKNVIEDYVKKYESERGERDMPLGAIRFSADKAKEGDENSRTSLYRTWAKKYAQQIGGKFEEKKDRYDNTYTIYFPRPKRKLATEAREMLNEIGNFQYPWSWIDWSWGENGYWFRAEAKSTAGTPVKVLIEGNPDEEIEVSFKRSGDGKWSMDKTGQGDEFKIFGTVANILDAFIERYNKEEGSTRPLHKLIFSAEKEKTPSFRGTKYSKTNRASLYSKMAEKLAKKYKAQFTQKEYAATTEYGFIFHEQKSKLATEAREVLDESPRLIQKAKETLEGFAKTLEEKGWEVGEIKEEEPGVLGNWQLFKMSANKEKYPEPSNWRDRGSVVIYVEVKHRLTKGQRASSSTDFTVYQIGKWKKVSMRKFWEYVNDVEGEKEYKDRMIKRAQTDHRKGRISDEDLADRLRYLGIEEAKIVWNTDQQKKLDKQKSKRRRSEKELFSSGPLKIKWSQTRGGYAIFVKGRMEGETFDSIDDAKEYLRELGIEESTSNIQIKLSKFGQRSSRSNSGWSGSSAGGNIKARITGYDEPAKAYLVDANGKTIESIELPFSKAADGLLNADGKVIFKLADEVHHIFITAANDHKKILYQYAIPNAYKI